MKESLKPNGEPVGVFVISIDDGWVEYAYRFEVGEGVLTSIDNMKRVICKALNARVLDKGTLRVTHKERPEGTLRVSDGVEE